MASSIYIQQLFKHHFTNRIKQNKSEGSDKLLIYFRSIRFEFLIRIFLYGLLFYVKDCVMIVNYYLSLSWQ